MVISPSTFPGLRSLPYRIHLRKVLVLLTRSLRVAVNPHNQGNAETGLFTAVAPFLPLTLSAIVCSARRRPGAHLASTRCPARLDTLVKWCLPLTSETMSLVHDLLTVPACEHDINMGRPLSRSLKTSAVSMSPVASHVDPSSTTRPCSTRQPPGASALQRSVSTRQVGEVHELVAAVLFNL